MISSPLRYPGGKGQLYEKVKEIMFEHNLFDRIYTEPFAGGFGIGIKLLTNGDVNRVIINDADKHIYAFWYSVFFETEKLIKLIEKTPINIDSWREQKAIYNNRRIRSLIKLGFSAFFLNRTNYSGVLKGGPIGGLNQEGAYKINCRLNKGDLIKRIQILGALRNQVEVYNMDAIDFINQVILPRQNEVFVNFDPPYVKKGPQLYKDYYNINDHENLANHIIAVLGEAKWIMTYDDCQLIADLYQKYNPEQYVLTHTAGKVKQGKELLIKNL